MKLIFALLSAVFLAGAGWLFVRRCHVALAGLGTVGHVVAHDRREIDDSVFFHPVIEFTDRQQVLRRFTAAAGNDKRHPAIGTPVAVRYLASDPGLAFIASFLHMWAAPFGFLALGLGALAAYMKW